MNTKDLILTTAKDLISEVGFYRMTTATLARRASISEGTIYRHFTSKEDILRSILGDFDEKYRTFCGECRERMNEGTLNLDGLLRGHFEFLRANAEDLKIVLGTYSTLGPTRHSMDLLKERICGLFAEFLEHGDGRGELRHVPLQATSILIANIFFGLMRIRLYWPEVEDVSGEAVEFCRRSLVISVGRR